MVAKVKVAVAVEVLVLLGKVVLEEELEWMAKVLMVLVLVHMMDKVLNLMDIVERVDLVVLHKLLQHSLV